MYRKLVVVLSSVAVAGSVGTAVYYNAAIFESVGLSNKTIDEEFLDTTVSGESVYSPEEQIKDLEWKEGNATKKIRIINLPRFWFVPKKVNKSEEEKKQEQKDKNTEQNKISTRISAVNIQFKESNESNIVSQITVRLHFQKKGSDSKFTLEKCLFYYQEFSGTSKVLEIPKSGTSSSDTFKITNRTFKTKDDALASFHKTYLSSSLDSESNSSNNKIDCSNKKNNLKAS